MSCKLKFNVFVDIDEDYADEIGEDLAIFLRESFFNGEDVLEVEYAGHDLIKK